MARIETATAHDYADMLLEREWVCHHFTLLSHSGSVARVTPAIVIAARGDVLHDEGFAYAERLKAAGVPVGYRRYAGMTHAFSGMAFSLGTQRRLLRPGRIGGGDFFANVAHDAAIRVR
jgi:acetyl esterase/lipase